MENNEKFDIKKFISPDAFYAPVYVWVWNDICTEEIIDAQLSEMQNLGIRAFYILPEPKEFRPDSMPTNLTPNYLSAEYFELCAYAIRKATTLGMQCWIYDEGGWPSGSACGKVIKDHPEYAQQILEVYEKVFSAGDVYRKTNPDVLATFINNNEIIEDGYVFSQKTVAEEYVAEKRNSDYPDLLNKDATEYFIRITHEEYARSLKNALGKNVTAVFTDEPKVSAYSFNRELADRYEKTFGESILPYLPLIAQNAEVTEENVHILHRWYDLCSRMFCENFLLPCKKWANEHGISFTGHMDVDHSPLGCVRGGGNFNLMRALRCMDIPGIDIIWQQLYPESKVTDKDDMNGYNGFFPRYASSAAAQNGTKSAMSEIFGVAGAGITYDIMRYTVGYQVVRGINIFNPFNFPLGRKEALLAQELPVFTENQPYCRHLSTFNRYVERISYLSVLGERVCETGLYYPIHDFQGGLKAESISEEFDALGRKLEDMMVDFDIVDDDVIQTAKGTDKGLIHIGRASYRTIIIPKGAYVPKNTEKVLDEFIKNGGSVLYELSGLTPAIPVDGEGLRVMHRKAENADLFFLFREKGLNDEYTVHLPQSDVYVLDLLNGTLQKANTENNSLKLSLSVGETAVIMLTDEKPEAENKSNFSEKICIENDFMFSKKTELVCNENGFENVKHTETAVPIKSGDWSVAVGKAYSGSGVYKTTFCLPAEKAGKEGEIDLGDVRFTAEVYINDQLLGAVLMPPYRFKIPAGVLKQENKLKVVVTNTSANWYVHTDYFDKWKTEELSPYFNAEIKYAEKYVSGGLYGPVALIL
ncbi:MAG: hypothetical protein IJ279_02865 [Clostridia bacterium]|nr:hypothetical protein [Clostridia bacterium]